MTTDTERHAEQHNLSRVPALEPDLLAVPPGDLPEPLLSQPVRQWREFILGAVSFLVFITILTIIIDRVGVQRLQEIVASAGPMAPMAYIAVKTLTYIFAPLTAGPLQLSAGVVFGLWEGVIYTLIGEVIGGSVSFFIARRFGRSMVVRLVGVEGIIRVDKFYRNNMGGWRSLVFARLLLFSFWDFLSYAAGLAPTRYRNYFLVSTIVGAIPTFMFVYLGTMLALDSMALYIAYALVAILIIMPLIFRKPLLRLMQRITHQHNE